MNKQKATETYLGDGLYASFDGNEIKLRAPRIEGDHIIYMEMSENQQTPEYALYFRKKRLSVWHPEIMMVIRHACDVDGICADKGGVRLREHFRIDERINHDNRNDTLAAYSDAD